MKKYKSSDVKEWFQKTKLKINSIVNKYEILTDCPYCGRDKFYFNSLKLVGQCKYASCARTPTIDDLIELIGYGPEQINAYWEKGEGSEKNTSKPLEFNVPPLFRLIEEHTDSSMYERYDYITDYPAAAEYLLRRKIHLPNIVKFDIRCDGKRIYVPVKNFNGDIVQYVSREYSEGSKGYLYAPGSSITDHILGWSECIFWDRITLVENTFVSIALRDLGKFSTNFGSHLSDTQIKLIKSSLIQSVVLIWDEGAEAKAQTAVNKLRENGILATWIKIKGQPDDHAPSYIRAESNFAHQALRANLK